VRFVSSNPDQEDTMKRIVIIGLAAAALAASLATASPAANRVPGFRSPSGNIRCLYVAGPPAMMLCTIDRSAYAKKLQDQCMAPGGAGLDWHGFTLRATKKGTPVCSGGILYNGTPSYVTLRYGKTWRHGSFTCVSRRSGVTCRSRAGHGLSVSRQAYRLW
jgi:Family of unknown function (DUF6636)